MERSFKAYVNQHLYNVIFDFVDAHIEVHPDELEEKIQAFRCLLWVELEAHTKIL